MLFSTCLCSPSKLTEFDEQIVYQNETVFQEYEGLCIARCHNCGILKTIKLKDIELNPQTSKTGFYEGKAELFKKLFRPTVRTLKRLHPGGSVLDVGCSSGILLELLKEAGYDIHGIEPNKSAYSSAHKKFKSRVFHGMLSQYIKKHRDKFDIIIYNHVLEHIEDPIKEIKHINEILKPGGLLVIGLPNTRNVIFLIRKKYWESLLPKQHFWHFSDIYLISFLSKSGFKVVSKKYANDKRRDYPLLKRIYFSILIFANYLLHTGEAMTIVFEKAK